MGSDLAAPIPFNEVNKSQARGLCTQSMTDAWPEQLSFAQKMGGNGSGACPLHALEAKVYIMIEIIRDSTLPGSAIGASAHP
jgi:hypothetical protein